MVAKRQRRDVDGILLLDKPEGGTSNRALQQVKRLFNARKAGHTGSLDPLATGMLPLCFGEATKVSGYLLDADKRYRVTCRLGASTTTADAEGEVLERRPVPALSHDDIQRAVAGFLGEQHQIPPMYSAVKHEGERLYRLARRGEEVERKPRRVVIYALDFVHHEGDTLELDVHCSKGTYVRTLIHDFGEVLGCGGHVSVLRRTSLGPFVNEPMVTMERLHAVAEQGIEALDALLLPPEAALVQWPRVTLDPDSAHFLCQGQAVFVPKAPAAGWVRVFGPDRFLGMGEVLDDGRIAPKRLMRVDG